MENFEVNFQLPISHVGRHTCLHLKCLLLFLFLSCYRLGHWGYLFRGNCNAVTTALYSVNCPARVEPLLGDIAPFTPKQCTHQQLTVDHNSK